MFLVGDELGHTFLMGDELGHTFLVGDELGYMFLVGDEWGGAHVPSGWGDVCGGHMFVVGGGR